MGNIYHITRPSAWLAAQEMGEYRDESLAAAGFIHCSTFEQVSATAKRYYDGQSGLILLEIDEAFLGNTVKYEMAAIGQLFPHCYRPIPVEAVVQIYPLIQGPDGEFSWSVPYSS